MSHLGKASLLRGTALASVLVSPGVAHAHNDFEIDVTGGYHFGTRIEAVQEDDTGVEVGTGDFRLDGSFAFSVIGGYRLQPNGFIYLSYTRQQTSAEYTATGTGAGSDVSGNVSLEYYQFGGNVEMTRGIIVPYMGVSIGLARLAALSGGDSSRVFFSPVFDSGMKIDLHENVHLRFLGRVPFVFTSKELYCATGAGCVATSKVKPLVQAELHAGIGVSF